MVGLDFALEIYITKATQRMHDSDEMREVFWKEEDMDTLNMEAASLFFFATINISHPDFCQHLHGWRSSMSVVLNIFIVFLIVKSQPKSISQH